MCETKPGLRCAAEAHTDAACASSAYESAHGLHSPAVDPLTGAAACFPVTSEAARAAVNCDQRAAHLQAALDRFEVRVLPTRMKGEKRYSVAGTAQPALGMHRVSAVAMDGMFAGVPVEEHLRTVIQQMINGNTTRAAEFRAQG